MKTVRTLPTNFFNDLTEYEADEIMRKFIAKGKDITIDGLSISPFSTEALSVSVFAPTEVTYPLKDFANTVVETPDKETDFSKLSTRELVMYAKKLQATLLAASDPVTVGSITVSFTAHSNKLQNLHDFADLLFSGEYEKNGKAKRSLSDQSAMQWEKRQKPTPARTAQRAITQWSSP